MQFFKAEISDILRCIQRDETFVNELQEYVVDMLKLLSGSKYNSIRQYVPMCASSWYYILTSLSNLQTLGEEYTGIIRLSNNEIPTKLAQLIWLILYVGGDKLFDKFLAKFGKKLYFSKSITHEAKAVLLQMIDFLKENKYIIMRLHQSIFFIYGTYHHLSNRTTGIEYVLIRQWMQDSSATTSFNILGKISIIYLLLLLIEKLRFQKIVTTNLNNIPQSNSSKICVLCVDNCKNISATPCGHLFCWDCIYDSIKYQPNCPICREEFKPSRIIRLQNYC